MFILIAILVGYVIKRRFLDPKGASRSANSSAAIPTSEGSEVQENLMRHQNAYYEYQHQQQQHQQQQQQQQYKTAYSTSSGGGNNCNGGSQYNNNRNNGGLFLSKTDPLPPPPPPPSESSSKYHQFPESRFQNQFQQGQFQNQYEVPHVVTAGGSGRYAPPPSLYGGSSVVQQSPIYPYRSQQYGEYYD